jgi:hypothetical protein
VTAALMATLAIWFFWEGIVEMILNEVSDQYWQTEWECVVAQLNREALN